MPTAHFYAERNRLYATVPYGKLVLNLGCGSGAFLRFWPHTERAFIVNVDLGADPHAGWPAFGVEHKGWAAFKELTAACGGMKNVDGDVRCLSAYPSGLFDVVVAGEVIEHMPLRDAHVALEEWHRVTAYGGYLQIDTPNRESADKDYEAHHEVEYSAGELKDLVAAHGFTLLELRLVNGDFGVWGLWRKGPKAPARTQGLGALVDQLSIANNKIFALEDRRNDPSVSDAGRLEAADKLTACNRQRTALVQAVDEYLADVLADTHACYAEPTVKVDPK